MQGTTGICLMELESITKNGNGGKEKADNLPFDASSMSDVPDSVVDKFPKASDENVSD